MRKFTKYNEKLREDKEFWFSQIANMDETPLFMNIASTKTIALIGSKEVAIKPMNKKSACHCNIMYNCRCY